MGRDIYDLGECLYSFLLRYGDEFVYWEDAVSVASGGIVPKSALGYANENSRWGQGLHLYWCTGAARHALKPVEHASAAWTWRTQIAHAAVN